MQQLFAMGFVDEALNSSLLLRYNNDIYSVVGELVRFSSTSALETAPTREAHFDTISTRLKHLSKLALCNMRKGQLNSPSAKKTCMYCSLIIVLICFVPSIERTTSLIKVLDLVAGSETE